MDFYLPALRIVRTLDQIPLSVSICASWRLDNGRNCPVTPNEVVQQHSNGRISPFRLEGNLGGVH